MIHAGWAVHRPRHSYPESCERQCGQLPDFAGACLLITTSMVILKSSSSTTPPPSRLAFHFTPKSWRLTLVVASMAALELPQGSLIGGGGPSTTRTTSLVTP